MKIIKNLPAPTPAQHDPDRDALQTVVHRRLALRLGLTLPVAAVFASLHGIGPNSGRRA